MRSQLAASRMFGFVGCICTSMNPVVAFAPGLMSCQVVPPSVVLYRPRSPPVFHAGPSAATYATLALVGCTTMRPMCCDLSRPIGFQVMPPSVLLNMPHPGSIELREFGSPVPRYTTFVSDGAMAIAPVEAQG